LEILDRLFWTGNSGWSSSQELNVLDGLTKKITSLSWVKVLIKLKRGKNISIEIPLVRQRDMRRKGQVQYLFAFERIQSSTAQPPYHQ